MFPEWWARYPKGRKIDRIKCERKFDRLSKTDRVAAAGDGYQRWLDHWATIEAQFIPHPHTWLNNRRWEADVPTSKPANPASNHTTVTDDTTWMYDTYRRVDFEAHEDDDQWPAYCNAVTGFEPMTAPTFDEWLAGE